MRRFFVLSFIFFVVAICHATEGHVVNYESLRKSLESAETMQERAEICCSIARLCCSFGDEASEKNDKRFWYSEGMDWALKAQSEDPLSAEGYYLHAICIGKDAQTRSLSEQRSAQKIVTEDYETITDTLGILDFCELWMAMTAAYYWNPFKSNACAVSYARAAVDSSEDGMLADACLQLAKVLHARDWSAKKRASRIASMLKDWNSCTSNLERYAYYEGKLGTDFIPVWTREPLSGISDSQEAVLLLEYADNQFRSTDYVSSIDTKIHEEILRLLAEW